MLMSLRTHDDECQSIYGHISEFLVTSRQDKGLAATTNFMSCTQPIKSESILMNVTSRHLQCKDKCRKESVDL